MRHQALQMHLLLRAGTAAIMLKPWQKALSLRITGSMLSHVSQEPVLVFTSSRDSTPCFIPVADAQRFSTRSCYC
jgi:hypothetical protein